MTLAATPEAGAGEPWAPLADLSDDSLTALNTDTDGVLGRSLRRVLRSLHDRDGVISAFGSFVSES